MEMWEDFLKNTTPVQPKLYEEEHDVKIKMGTFPSIKKNEKRQS